MEERAIIEARKKAERAVEGMTDPSLKLKAFEQIFGRLLHSTEVGDISGSARSSLRKVPAGPRATSRGSLGERLHALREDGFFTAQRSLGDIREELGSRGWHYPLTTLSGVMQRLVRKRELRRERVKTGSKKIWKYVSL